MITLWGPSLGRDQGKWHFSFTDLAESPPPRGLNTSGQLLIEREREGAVVMQWDFFNFDFLITVYI